MTRGAVATWVVALALVALLGVGVLHARSQRIDACAGSKPHTPCTQAEKSEAGMELLAALSAVLVLMGGGMARAMTRRR